MDKKSSMSPADKVALFNLGRTMWRAYYDDWYGRTISEDNVFDDGWLECTGHIENQAIEIEIENSKELDIVICGGRFEMKRDRSRLSISDG